MGFTLLWTAEDIENAATDFSDGVADDLAEALEEKEKQIRWKDNLTELSSRFHNTFGLADLHIAEIAFTSLSAEYRAICVVFPEKQEVVYYTLVPKKGSHQDRQLEIMREKSAEIEAFIRKKSDRSSS
ncbi:MAG: hypothetical protein SVW02_01275 [Candidatus Nanohaloarchaea archaeon]|nr:hypothetical protein [Candidatus Nanohaloarchaea archaeon]